MPPPSHYRLQYSGVLGSVAVPLEEWSVNLSLGTPGDPFMTQPNLKTLAEQLAPHWGTHVAPKLAANAVMTRCRVASVNGFGLTPRDVSGAYIQGDAPASTPGVSTPTLPFQVSLAISLHSDASGPTGRGRFYLPSPVLGPITDGLFSAANRDGIMANMKAFLDAINGTLAAGAYGLSVVIASGGSPTKGLQPALHPVRQISVGRRPDIQRRRAGSLPESRTYSSLA